MTTAPHAIRRAKERYDLDLTIGDLTNIASCIQDNRGRFIGYGDNGATVWKLKWRKTWMRLVIDRTFYVVITFLPKSGPVACRVPPPGAVRKRQHV